MLVLTLALTADAHAGFLYSLNQVSSGLNQIHGFNVNEATGVLTPLAGFPVSSGGNGINTFRSEQIIVDAVNRRLYVINDGSNTVTAFSIDVSTGALTTLPFSPIALGDGSWTTMSIHPMGSPLVVGDATVPGKVLSFNITSTTATPAVGSPYTTGAAPAYSSSFSHDGYFVYTGGGSGNNVAGFSVNQTTGSLTPLPGSSFNSGGVTPSAYVTDMWGRLFTASSTTAGDVRGFTTIGGVPTAVAGNPFASGLTSAVDGALSPDHRHYYVVDQSGNRVGAYEIPGTENTTTITPLAGSPVSTGGVLTSALVLNSAGNFLYAANSTTRNITTFERDTSTGALTFGSVQAANTLGATGRLTGIAYQPPVFTVTNLNDTGVGSLRQAALDANASGGGVIIFSSFFDQPRTISVGTGNISLNSHVTVRGPGAQLLKVQNTGSSRVFLSNDIATLIGLTITGGNTAGGGGGILSQGQLTVRRCTITGNVAALYGGGISGNGVTALIDSTVSGNTANGAANVGGGIIHFNNLITIVNSTISGNSASGTNSAGGLFLDGGGTKIVSSTITDNLATGAGSAGGISKFGAGAIIANSIIAGNRNNATTPDVAITGSNTIYTSRGFNLIGNRGTIFNFTVTGDQTGTGASPLDPRLAPLTVGSNGLGTHALLPDSSAIDKGSSFNFLTDERGVARPSNVLVIPNLADGSDIGAFEKRAGASAFDFDGDGKTDIGIFRPTLGEWWYLRSSDGVVPAFQFGLGSDKIVPADYTGDGKTDVANFRPSTGEWFVLRSEDLSYFSFPFGASDDTPVPADYDNDGKADPAIFRPSNGLWVIQRSSDNGTTFVQFGADGDKPVPADYDGDGRTDIAIYRPSVGQWWLLRSSAGVIAFSFGSATDRAVPGDYTGDGKADVAFWRPSTGEWFVLRSEDLSYYSVPFGIGPDRPVPGDYDGDGKYDTAVFRPSGATWFIQRSSSGSLAVQFGILTDRVIPGAFVP